MRNRAHGQLEAETMHILRTSDTELSARDILDRFSEPIPAYTTLLTALDRLCQKGQVQRGGPSPRKVRFWAVESDAEHWSNSMLSALGEAENREAALLKFAGNLDQDDVELLHRVIAARKAQRDGAARRP